MLNSFTNELKSLPCFSQVTEVNQITGGLSNICYQVNADGKYYFAKKLSTTLFDTELLLSSYLAKQGVAPEIFYHDEHWIISQFISGENLAQQALPLMDKVTISIQLMTTFHQLPFNESVLLSENKVLTDSSTLLAKEKNNGTIPTLNIINNINELLSQEISPAFRAACQKIAIQLDNLITPATISNANNNVCCHSDINFSNVLIDTNQRAWLIDFEYACKAPIEFDIAMLMAINNVPLSYLLQVISLYEQQTSTLLNKDLCRHLLLFSYFINGLWYYKKSLKNQPSPHTFWLKLAEKQWLLYSDLSDNLSLANANTDLFNRLRIKL